MSITIPLRASLANYEFNTTINEVTYAFSMRWNARDSAWYMDILEVDQTPVVYGVKIVLGTYLGRTTNHPLFRSGVMTVTDTTGVGREAGFDDIGSRVVVQWYSNAEVVFYTSSALVS